MNTETITQLVWNAQIGQKDALEELLLQAFPPVFSLCKMLLKDQQAAREQTYEVLKTVAHNLDSLQDGQQFETWLLRITAARCIHVLPQLRWASDVDETSEEPLPLAGEHLDEAQTAEAIRAMVDRLPEDSRIAILLHCCCRMRSHAIGQLTGCTQETVRGHLQRGLSAIQEMLNSYQQQGTEFSGISSLEEILYDSLYHLAASEDPIAVVYPILGKEIPIPPDPEKAIIRILAIVLAILIAADLIVGGILVVKLLHRPKAEIAVPTLSASLQDMMPTTLPVATTMETVVETEPTRMASESQNETTAAVQSTAATSPATTAPVSGGNTANPDRTQVPADAPKTGTDGHTHRYLTTRTNFNCETGGTRRYLCADCDYYYEVTLSPTGSHKLTTVPDAAHSTPTCTSAAKLLRLCTNCNYVSTLDDPNKPALGHDYAQTVVAPTETKQGYTQYTCTRCSNSYTDNFVDPLPASTEPAPTEPAPTQPEPPATQSPPAGDNTEPAGE